jgi:fumarate reductase subunit C
MTILYILEDVSCIYAIVSFMIFLIFGIIYLIANGEMKRRTKKFFKITLIIVFVVLILSTTMGASLHAYNEVEYGRITEKRCK